LIIRKYILNGQFSNFSHFLFLWIEFEAIWICFFWYYIHIKTQVNRNFSTSTFLFFEYLDEPWDHTVWYYSTSATTKLNIFFRKLNNNISCNNNFKYCFNKLYYLTLYTFSIEINENRQSDTRCLIQDVVSPHCGDKRMARRCTRRSLSNYFDMTSYHWNVRQNIITWHWWMNRKNNLTSYTKCSLPQEYCTHFNSTLAISLKFVFIEMLDKVITYIVWWYQTVYQVLSVAWTNRITTSRDSDS
jgi:hypothetical protein